MGISFLHCLSFVYCLKQLYQARELTQVPHMCEGLSLITGISGYGPGGPAFLGVVTGTLEVTSLF